MYKSQIHFLFVGPQVYVGYMLLYTSKVSFSPRAPFTGTNQTPKGVPEPLSFDVPIQTQNWKIWVSNPLNSFTKIPVVLILVLRSG